jgi:hypothetical protein
MGQETQRRSFIVRVWLEETAEEAGQAAWRGSVTSVPNGDQHYIQDLDDIPGLIAPYLEKMGIKLKKRRRLQRWLEKLKT